MTTSSSASTYISKINSGYPVAGIDNDTQGFRDNFKNIKLALEHSDEDLTSLKLNTVDLTSPVTDFNDNIIKRATLQDCSLVVYDLSSTIQTGDVVVDYKNGSYQKFTISSGTHWFNFINLPLENRASSLILSISTSTSQSTTINFSGNTVYNRTSLPLPATLAGENPHIFEISNDGIDGNIFVKEYRETKNYQLNVLNFANIQAALTSATNSSLYFPAGTYVIESRLNIPSNIKIIGEGQEKTKLILSSSFLSNFEMLTSTSGTNISIENLTIDGNNNPTRLRPLLTLDVCNNIKITNVTVKNNSHIGIELGGCENVLIQNSRFENCGRLPPNAISTPAIWCDSSPENVRPKRITIDNCYFVNNNWSGAYFMPDDGKFTNNFCFNNGESTLFSSYTATNVLIEGNHINGTTRRHISGSGLELGGQNYIIKNNIIQNCASDGISLTDIKNSIIEGNVCFNNGKETTWPGFQNSGGISIASVSTTSFCVNNIITGNRCFDNTGTQKFGIIIYAANPLITTVTRTLITNNNTYQNVTDGIRNWQNNSIDTTTTIYKNILNDGSFA